ncbi:PAS domain S-box protein [Halopiger thermotolerans]
MNSSSRTSNEALERRIRRQEAAAEFGDRALEADDLESLFRRATVTVAATVAADGAANADGGDSGSRSRASSYSVAAERGESAPSYTCTLLESFADPEADADRFRLRERAERAAGDGEIAGRPETPADAGDGKTTFPVDRASHAGRALRTGEPIVVDDFRADDRFRGPDPPLERARSAVSVVVGRADEPWGVLSVHATARGRFDDADVTFLRTVASALASAVERLRADQRRSEEASLRRTILETSPVGITLIDADGRNVFSNDRAEEILGRSAEELRNYTHDDERWNLVDEQGEPIESDDLPLSTVAETGEPVYDDVVGAERPDGTRVWISMHCSPIFDADGEFDGAVYAFRDITERKHLESRLEEILGRVDDAICAFDTDLRYTHVNERAEELLGQSESELLGERLWDQFPEAENDDAVRESFETAMETQEPTSYEHYYEPIDAWFEVTVYPSETGLSVYFRDVTERREYERKLEASNERLEQFASAASHDLQEPLRMVTSYLQLLEDRYADELDEDGEEFIEFAVDGAERMREMIDGLLEFSRVETQGEPFEPVELDEVLEDVRQDLSVCIEESGAEIEAESLPRVEGDGNQLRQVFQNLLSNAIEHSGDEPPQIEVSSERAPSGDWEISVSDDGVGIDPDDQERIFGVFERLYGTGERDGNGIGLALCRRIVERHGGEIQVDSEPGEGATFSFTLPPASADE